MSENQARQEQEFEANQNQTPQEPETSEALSEEDLENVTGGAFTGTVWHKDKHGNVTSKKGTWH
ncbi:hypothetical protein [Pleurocapsa sp. PCC 7319]|uniref:hypothetical protein n=1 Tax=Pleurocapsa sp. PCC 7319 TaxID=118161 RepID=UPI000344E14C|nr:hypothetical protein [Pleurocapsa sp. PCC 7319]